MCLFAISLKKYTFYSEYEFTVVLLFHVQIHHAETENNNSHRHQTSFHKMFYQQYKGTSQQR